MNAYELADRLFKANFKESANMIIQQADRIAELEELNQIFVELIQSYRVETETLRQEILKKTSEK